MKKLLVVILVLSVSLCFAGDFGLFKVAPTVGIIVPESDWGMGPQLGAKAYVGSLMDGKVGLYPVVSYWSSKYDWNSSYISKDLELKMSNIKLGIDGHYDLSEYFAGLYAGAGLSLNILSIEYPSFDINYLTGEYNAGTESDSETKLGISVLVGYNLELSGKPLFFEATYDLISDLNTLGVKAGMYFDLKK